MHLTAGRVIHGAHNAYEPFKCPSPTIDLDQRGGKGRRHSHGKEGCWHDSIVAAYRSPDESIWVGQLKLVFSFKDSCGRETEAAFLRWFQQTSVPQYAQHLGLNYFKWSGVRLPGSPSLQPDYDIVHLESIEGPIMLQKDPRASERWFHNHFF